MEHITFKVRYRTGAYHASVAGKKAKGSSSISAIQACSVLLGKLHPGAKLTNEGVPIPSGSSEELTIIRFSFDPAGDSTSLSILNAGSTHG